MTPKKPLAPGDREQFLGAMMYWCFKWGCEVRLTNRAYNYPTMDRLDPSAFGESHERDRNGNLVDMDRRTGHRRIEIPELVFSRGDKHVSMYGATWEDLMEVFKHQHRRIYMELSVPMLDWPAEEARKERK